MLLYKNVKWNFNKSYRYFVIEVELIFFVLDKWRPPYEPKWVNSDYIKYGVNSLRLGGFHIWKPVGQSDVITEQSI